MWALGSPVAVGQGCSSPGMWGSACSRATLLGLYWCWARPLGPVKHQDRSKLGERGTGESLNKEFLIWICYSPFHLRCSASLGTVPPLSAAAPSAVASPPALPWRVLGAPTLGAQGSLAASALRQAQPWCLSLSRGLLCAPLGAQGSAGTAGTPPRGRGAAASGVQREDAWLKREPQSVQGGAQRVCPAQKRGGGGEPVVGGHPGVRT